MPDSTLQLYAANKKAKNENKAILSSMLSGEYAQNIPEYKAPEKPLNLYDQSNVGPSQQYEDYVHDPTGVEDWGDINLMRARGQSHWEQFSNVFKRAPWNIGLGIVSNLAAAADIEDIYNIDDEIGNPVSNLMMEWQDKIREKLPIYQEDPNKAFALDDFGYVMSNASMLLDSAGAFAGSAWITGGLLSGISKVLTSEAAIARLTAKYGAKAAKMVEQGKIAASEAEAVRDGMVSGAMYKGAVIGNAYASSQGERVMEAKGVYDTVLSKQLAENKPYEEAHTRALNAAEVDMNINSVNFLSNLTSAGMFTGARKYIANSIFKKPAVELATETVQESFEEGVNYIAQKEGELKGDVGNKYVVDIGRYASHLADERGLEAMALGGIGGAAQTAISRAINKTWTGAKDILAARRAKKESIDPAQAQQVPNQSSIDRTNVTRSNIEAVTNYINKKDLSLEANDALITEMSLNNLEADLSSSKPGTPAFDNIDKHIAAFEAMGIVAQHELDQQSKAEKPDATAIQDSKDKLQRANDAIARMNAMKEFAKSTPEAIGAPNAKAILLSKMDLDNSSKNLELLSSNLNSIQTALELGRDTMTAEQIANANEEIRSLKKAIKTEKTKNTKASNNHQKITSKAHIDSLLELKKAAEDAAEAARVAEQSQITATKINTTAAKVNNIPSKSSSVKELPIAGGVGVGEKYLGGMATGTLSVSGKNITEVQPDGSKKVHKAVEASDVSNGLKRSDNDNEARLIRSGDGYYLLSNNQSDPNLVDVSIVSGVNKDKHTDDEVIAGALKDAAKAGKDLNVNGVVIGSDEPVFNVVKDVVEKDNAAINKLMDSPEEYDTIREAVNHIRDTQNSRIVEALTPLMQGGKLSDILNTTPEITADTAQESTEDTGEEVVADDELIPEVIVQSAPIPKSKVATPKRKKYTVEKELSPRSTVIAVGYLNQEYTKDSTGNIKDRKIIEEFNKNNSPSHTYVGLDVILTIGSDTYETYVYENGELVYGEDGNPKKRIGSITEDLRTKPEGEAIGNIPIEIRSAKDGRLMGYVQTMSWTDERETGGVGSQANHNFKHFDKLNVTEAEIQEARRTIMNVRRAIISQYVKTGKVSVATKVNSVSFGVVHTTSTDIPSLEALSDIKNDNTRTFGVPYLFGAINGSSVVIPSATEPTGEALFDHTGTTTTGTPVVIFQAANGEPISHPVHSRTITQYDPVVAYIKNALIALKSGKINETFVKTFVSEKEIIYNTNGTINRKSINKAVIEYINQFIQAKDQSKKFHVGFEKRGDISMLKFNLGVDGVFEDELVGSIGASDEEANRAIDAIINAIVTTDLKVNFDIRQLADNKPIISINENGLISEVAPSVEEFYLTTTRTNLASVGKVDGINIYVKQAVVGVDLKSILDQGVTPDVIEKSPIPVIDDGDVKTKPEDDMEKMGEEAKKMCTTSPKVRQAVVRKGRPPVIK